MASLDDELGTQIRRMRRISKHNGFPLLYHITSKECAENLLVNGFRDEIIGRGPRVDGDYSAGVWLSNRPLDLNDGVGGTLF
jgi:hypothetical protein